ncbi:NlpC/P60 family protein [Micromonospora pisi]|uniref:NlpC/P60 family protein n=1 Tax=Micromonospora pisi TaxID=589240 RepID=A0A495JGS1_9ACTN|nr:C40 family peptidase [Micromonospora pisi]RKR87985.1 NlpC/P60 family protein [Micromonospora pisi]
MPSARILLRSLVLAGLAVGLIAPTTIAQAEPSAAELTQQINKSSTELEKIVESYNKLNEQIKGTKAAVADLGTKLGPLEQQATQSRAEVAALATKAYKAGGLRTADALLGDNAAESLVNRLGTLDYLARNREEQLAGLTAAQQEYIDQKARLDATLARQTSQAKELDAGKKKIEGEIKKLSEMRRKAYGSVSTSGSKYTGKIPAVSGKAGVAVTYAYNAIGKPYVWAAEGPNGYDCSGLTLAAWKAAGKSLPHNAEMQWNQVAHISRGSLQPGDLVFYSGLGHVALYVGSNQVIHAPSFGENVTLASVDMMTPYGYGRVG